MVTRRLTPADVPALIRLQEACYPEDLWSSREDIEDALAWDVAHGIFEGESLLGVISGYAEEDVFHVYSIEVAPTARRRGIGKQLLQLALDTAAEREIHKVRGWAVSEGGRQLCESVGFKATGERVPIDLHVADVMLLEGVG